MKAYPQFKWMPIEEQYAPMGGMDLRDYFAAKAMQALVTQQDWFNADWHLEAGAAYEIADKMMEARNGSTK